MRHLIVRIGGYGDALIVSPLFRVLKEKGHEVYVLTSDQGMEVFKDNPHIDKLIYHETNSVEMCDLSNHFDYLMEEYECEVLIDLCESIEEKYLFHPTNPKYNYPKNERFEMCNVNFYDATMEIAGFDEKGLLPEIYFSESEEEKYQIERIKLLGKRLVIWSLSGSSLHKSYPYTHLVMEKILKAYPDVYFITVGDEKCQLIELALKHERVIHKSGIWSFRETAIACKYADLVIAPETGVIHLAGCFKTPKICFLTHTTQECVTKYFLNDYSIQADVPCSPCFRIIYEAKHQCPIDYDSYAPFCTGLGFHPQDVVDCIDDALNKREKANVGS